MPPRHFSLRLLMGAVASGCIALGYVANRALTQRDAVRTIQDAGGIVQYSFAPPVVEWEALEDEIRLAPNVQPGGLLASVLGIDYCYVVRAVVLRQRISKYTEGDSFIELDDVASRNDDVWKLTQTTLKALRNLPELRVVYLEGRWPTSAVERASREIQRACPQCQVIVERTRSTYDAQPK